MSPGPLLETIRSEDPGIRDRDFHGLCRGAGAGELLAWAGELERFRREAGNLYAGVRAAVFLYALHRFHLAEAPGVPERGRIAFQGVEALLARRFEEALGAFLAELRAAGPSGALCSALAAAYYKTAFQMLADQVRRSVRASRGNQWLFRGGRADEHPVRLRRELLDRPAGEALFPVLREVTPVRLDLSHSGWSDIFFLGMDYPEGARVINLSVDLGVYGRDRTVRPPIECFLRAIPEPVLRLTSVDLGATREVLDLEELFDFGRDYLGLLKAGLIAGGLVPPACEGTGQPLAALLARSVAPGMGIELVTRVGDIPKGSRLAVSTNLLASIVSLVMRASGQTERLEGPLGEAERRLAASRAILGEWLGGSGGGWQDSGGLWPGLKAIEGVAAGPGDPEWGISRGCLLPRHRLLDGVHPEAAERLARSLVLVHGGMAQDVGPILEMVTEKYLLRDGAEWRARMAMRGIYDSILENLRLGEIAGVAAGTTANWDGPLKTIIPWVTNRFTEILIRRAKERAGKDYLGFLMLGGMSGGGMGLFVAPGRRDAFREELLEILGRTKAELEEALPFAMQPVVYDFGLNATGSTAALLSGAAAFLPAGYYRLQVPELARRSAEELSRLRRLEMDRYTAALGEGREGVALLRSLVGHVFQAPASRAERLAWDEAVERIKKENGFDPVQHERTRADLKAGRIGLARNRLPAETQVEDVRPGDVAALADQAGCAEAGRQALSAGKVAVLTLAAGLGSRWTGGAGVVKALHPFAWIAGAHRSFLEVHLAKSARSASVWGRAPAHVVATSHLTHAAVVKHLELNANYGYPGPLLLSPGRSVGQRLVPMVRDLDFLWEELSEELLDERRQKVREGVRRALREWARRSGEGEDYVENVPRQRLHPLGHWYEVPGLLRNGVLSRLLESRPGLETLMLHNIDTLGADLDPAALGFHLLSGRDLTFEVVARRLEDRGGGLARVNGALRLLEGLAQPREEDELKLGWYNTMTTWIRIDSLLRIFGLRRSDLAGPPERIDAAVRETASRLPSYVTIKEAKLRWGHGQEDVYPVAQVEKLWSDMSSLPGLSAGYLAVPRLRGQQLKEPAQLDGWARDGSLGHVERLCDFPSSTSM